MWIWRFYHYLKLALTAWFRTQWFVIDNVITFGLARRRRQLRLSRHLRSTRKRFAKVTGFHGLLSGKKYSEATRLDATARFGSETIESSLDHDSTARSSRNHLG